jgi:predicted ATPase with chaperone activity
MPEDQDIRQSLARAFDRAWDRYYRSGRVTMNQDVARTELARKLVQLSRQGVRDEWHLSAAALIHLRGLTSKDGNTEKP